MRKNIRTQTRQHIFKRIRSQAYTQIRDERTSAHIDRMVHGPLYKQTVQGLRRPIAQEIRHA
jgi:hypothetical protein